VVDVDMDVDVNHPGRTTGTNGTLVRKTPPFDPLDRKKSPRILLGAQAA